MTGQARPAGSVPPRVVAGIVAAAVVLFGSIGAWRHARLRRLDAASPRVEPAPAAPERRSVRVETWIPPERVRHASRFAFTHDGPEELADLRREEGLDAVVAGAASDEAAYQRLMHWTRAQFEPGWPDPYPSPDARTTLREIRSGRTGGFCAQYCFVLVQAVHAMGLRARCVSVRGHEVVEAWLGDEQRWTMLDPTFDLQVLDGSGCSLSVLQVHDALVRGTPWSLSPGHRLVGSPVRYLHRFSRFAVWLRNDFVTRPENYWDFDRYRVFYAPGVDPRTLPPDSLRTHFVADLYP